jgi:hypothetical protein
MMMMMMMMQHVGLFVWVHPLMLILCLVYALGAGLSDVDAYGIEIGSEDNVMHVHVGATGRL